MRRVAWAAGIVLGGFVAGCDGATPAAADAGTVDAARDAGTPSDLGAPVDRPSVADVGTDAGAADAAADGPPVPYAGPDDWCPGREHCMGAGDHQLYVGAGRALVNPTLVESDWTDLNGDHEWQRNEPFVDVNGNGRFDATWMAGFGNGRPARGQHDDLEVRAIAFRYGDVTVAWAVIDCVGYFINDMDAARADPTLAGLDVDRVIISATHVHEAVDTVGMWGPTQTETGLNATYQQLTHQRIAQAVRAALGAMRPVSMRVAQVVPQDSTGDTRNWVNDTRDPVIYDPTLTIVRFTDTEHPGTTVATWVNWAAHPEYSGSRNNQLSADYVHYIRDVTENGDAAMHLAGLGGTTVFVQGALGGQVGPGGTHVPDDTGALLTDSGLDKAAAAGRAMGRMALDAITAHGTDVASSDLSLSYRTAAIAAQVENVGYQGFYLTNIFSRDLLAFDPALPFGPDNIPWVRSRVTYLQVGPVATITAPGELHPDLWVGTRDTRWSWGQPTLTPMQPNEPDLGTAPAPPYLRDLVLANPGVRWGFVSGLTEDFLGYIVPSYNFLLDPVAPYLHEPTGDHYEETNSVGPGAERFLQYPMMALARWRAP